MGWYEKIRTKIGMIEYQTIPILIFERKELRPMTPITEDMISLLRCPESGQTLSLLNEAGVKTLVEKQANGDLKDRRGETIDNIPEGALIREDQQIAYIIVESVPVMLIDHAIPMDQLN